MQTLLARLGYQKRASALFAMSAWADAVGTTVALHAVPDRVEQDVLHVVVDGAPWANELRWMESALVAQLNGACGRTVVSRLRFRIGTLPRQVGDLRDMQVGRTERAIPLPEMRERARSLASGVQDAALADAWQRLVAQGLMRQRGNSEGESPS